MQAFLAPIIFAQGIDPDTTAWLNRVATAGGQVPTQQRNAVNQFVKGCKAAGIWSLLRRVNLVCGDFPATFVPLVNLVGGATDTNVNLVSGDYASNTGWVTDGATKYVDTGYTPSEATGSLSVYLRTAQIGSTTSRFFMGASGSLGSQQFRICGNKNGTNVNTSGNVSGCWGGSNVGPMPATTFGNLAGMWQITRRSGTDAEMYFNGASVSTATNAIVPATTSCSMFVFCVNSTGAASAFVDASTACGGYVIDTGMTTAQAVALYSLMQTFQISLGRQV